MERRFAFYYDVAGSILRLLGLGPEQSWIVVRPDALLVHMGWAFDVGIPRGVIASAQRADAPRGFAGMFVGWGVHTTFDGTWYVNGSQQHLVRIDLTDPVRGRALVFPVTIRTLYLSIDEPEAFLRNLR